jgi:hypothetical protein
VGKRRTSSKSHAPPAARCPRWAHAPRDLTGGTPLGTRRWNVIDGTCPARPATDDVFVRTSWWRLGASVVIGAVAAWATRTLDIPGDGTWIVVCVAMGVAAGLVQASWASFAACEAGVILASAVFVIVGGQYAGLAWLVVASVAAMLGYGFLMAAVIGRAWRLRSVNDRRVVGGLIAVLGLLVSIVLIARDLARNPP